MDLGGEGSKSKFQKRPWERIHEKEEQQKLKSRVAHAIDYRKSLAGRKWLGRFGVGACLVGCVGYMWCETYGIGLYRRYVKYTRDVEIEPAISSLEELKAEVMKESKLTARFHKGIFLDVMGTALYPMIIGGTALIDGMHIILPKWIYFNEEKQKMSWENILEIEQADDTTLSDKAKKFVIAKYLQLGNNYYMIYNCSLLIVAYFGHVLLTAYVNDKRGFETKLVRRLGIYAGSASMFLSVWAAGYWAYNWHKDRMTDNFVANLSPDYAAGGLEYYTKLAKKQALVTEGKPSSLLDAAKQFVPIQGRTVPIANKIATMEKFVEKYAPKSKSVPAAVEAGIMQNE